MKLGIVLLAAGNSRRFGSNKLLYEIEGKPMYVRALETMKGLREQMSTFDGASETREVAGGPSGLLCARITVVTQYAEIGAYAKARGIHVVYNPHPEEGIASSLRLGLLENLDADACLFAVSDQPWLSTETLGAMVGRFRICGEGIVCAASGGVPGNPCIFAKRYYEELLSLTGDRGGKQVVKAHMEDVELFEVEEKRELEDMDVKSRGKNYDSMV